MRHIAVRIASLAVFAVSFGGAQAEAKRCPRVLDRATRLIVVTVPDMSATKAEMRTYERASPAAHWGLKTGAEPAVIGARGIGWGTKFVHMQRGDEPIKQEGDKRSPAGIYRFGATFGFEAAKRAGHMQLEPGKQFCVDDLRSPHYGRIVKKSVAGEGVSGEDMATFPQFKHGIVVDYPPRRDKKAGSCIFLHVWQGAGVGTAGCVALPEERVSFLQSWAASRNTVIAILEQEAIARFDGCVPDPAGVSASMRPVVPQPNPRRVAAGRLR